MPRILVIEDTPANLTLATAILESAGHVVVPAPDAERGLDIARRESIDLVLMDMRLPGMNGLAATGLLKADPATRHIPVIALTASAMKGDEERMRQAGCDGYVAKPIRYRELLEAIDRMLAQGGPSP